MSKLTVVIGRFQPLHNEHIRMIEHAISLGEQTLVLVGSAFEPRTLKNPWTYQERRGMLKAVFGDRIDIAAIRDYPYEDESWFENVKTIIKLHSNNGDEVTIVGCAKDGDDSTWYLNHFPEYTVEFFQPQLTLDATAIRQDLWEGFGLNPTLVPLGVYNYITDWDSNSPEILWKLKQQFVDVNKYQKQWGKGPFLCVDSILMSEGEWFAIINHKEGTLALPGGFLDYGETTLNGARRECREEIGFDPGNSPTDLFIADKPDRDPRCHNVSIVYVWDVGDDMPELIAGDDAVGVRWMDWNEIQTRREEFRADHWHLLERAYFNS